VKLADDFRTPRDILERLLKENPDLVRGNGFSENENPLIHQADLRAVFARLDDELLQEEINLLYVALTRAKREIDIPRKYLIAGK
jgi:ATP-dependent exoDNAse (exonuclease V) beta subunit